MQILVVGGTRFVGRHFVAQAVAAGHEVTLFHRGRTGGELFPDLEHRIGDRDGDLAALTSGQWDATVDACAYVPRQVHALADVLGDRGGHYLLVSSVSAYAVPSAPGIAEDAPLIELADPTVENVTAETYGGLKVLCEKAAVARHGTATLLVRPTYVVGPDDYTWRFPWWVHRLARGGQVAVPGPADNPAQLIDARDLGAFMTHLLGTGATGAFNAVGPEKPLTWGEQMQAVAALVAPPGTSLRWLEPAAVEVLLQEAGRGAFPLWAGTDNDRWIETSDPAKALAAGLKIGPFADTIRDTLAWTRVSAPADGVGLSPDREAALLAAS
jgi:nucleoside-diphosphate-sugar epimerase